MTALAPSVAATCAYAIFRRGILPLPPRLTLPPTAVGYRRASSNLGRPFTADVALSLVMGVPPELKKTTRFRLVNLSGRRFEA